MVAQRGIRCQERRVIVASCVKGGGGQLVPVFCGVAVKTILSIIVSVHGIVIVAVATTNL